MRILTVIAGILISACGAFCFAVYTNPFTDVAFLVGLVMVVSGGCNLAAYLVSGRGNKRTTDTALVEGLVTLLYGFAVLSNSVTDLMLTLFFGTWLTLSGVTRFSQALYVSRFRPRDWAKVIPLAAIASMLGIVMMMPKLVSAVMPLMLVGGAFICDGLSMLMYSMYMKRPTAAASKKEEEAKERAAARKAQTHAQREERDRLRNLSKKERDAEIERQRKEQEAKEEAKKKQREEERAKKREAARPASEKTMEFTPEEVAEINAAAKEPEGIKENILSEDENKTVINLDENNPMAAIWATMAEESGADVKVNKPEPKEEPALESEAPATRPIWQRPTDIPSLRAERDSLKEDDDIAGFTPIKFTAVNLEEIESRKPVVEFEKVELPEFKIASDTESVNRSEVLEQIDNTTLEKADADYTPISLEELVAEPLARPYDPNESKRFTQTLHFGWLEDNDNE